MKGDSKKEAKPFDISGKKKLKIILVLFAAVIVLCIVLLLVSLLPGRASSIQACGDGTAYGACSLDKPYYCLNGILVQNASGCGCPALTKDQGNMCVTSYQTNPEKTELYYVLNGQNHSVNLTIYGGLSTYLSLIPEDITYSGNQTPKRYDFISKRMNDPNEEIMIMPLVKDIENLAPNSKVNQARIAISMVQNIPWGSSGKTISLSNAKSTGYSRYPYQVLYDNQGLCGEKSELLADLLRSLGYGVALFYYPNQNHEAVGIKCPIQDSLEGTGYCFVESSGPAIISDSSIIYVGGITLSKNPEVIPIANGTSLPPNLPEYTDAKILGNLRKRTWLDPISISIFNKINQKYGLENVYHIN